MKQYLVVLLSLALITNSNCGLIDGLFGTVRDTTSSITQNIGGALHYGKNIVFGSSEPNAAGQIVTKPGIVGTISLKIHDVSQAVREEFRSVLTMFDGDQVHEKGVLGRLLDRVKCRVLKIKSFLSGDNLTHIENMPHTPFKKLNNDSALLCDKLRKHFFKNGASGNKGIKQTLFNLQEAINRIRMNVTKQREDAGNGNNEQDGTGLIDIRTSVNDLAGDLQNNFENGNDAANDKVNDGIDEGRATAISSLNRAKQNSNKFIEDQRRNYQNHYNQYSNNVNRFRSDVDNSINDIGVRVMDESDRVKNEMQNAYSKVDFESQGNWGRGY